jgi:hypothetical protein
MIPLSLVEFKETLMKSLKDGKLLEEASAFLGPKSLAKNKLRNWELPGRKIPKAFFEGAVLALLNPRLSEMLAYPIRLAAKSAWHVYYVLDESAQDGRPQEYQDCHAWHVWEGMTAFGERQQGFAHTALSNREIGRSFEPIGVPEMRRHAGVEGERTTMITCSCIIEPSGSYTFGYYLRAPKVMRSYQEEKEAGGLKHEFLGGINVVPVERSYLVASIPRRTIHPLMLSGALDIPWISFATHVIQPIDFVKRISAQVGTDKFAEYWDREGSRFEPWGQKGKMEDWAPRECDLKIPSVLKESLRVKTAEGWDSTNPAARAPMRRTLYTVFDRPHPLTYQSLIYRLPEKNQFSEGKG